MESDEEVLQDACAVFGCVTSLEVAESVNISNIIYLGLMALQHRGQESSGMVTYDGNQMFVQKGMGLVSNVYGTDTAKHLTGHIGIGHNRYSTAGKSEMINCQPFVVDTVHGKIAVAHNGELVNAKSIRQRLLKHGIGLSSETDSELITQLMVSEPPGGEPNGADWAARIKHLMELIKCSYSVVVLTSHGLFGFRDPHGNRPLCIGKCDTSFAINHENGKKQLQEAPVWIFSSESCAFHSIGATLVREVEPGEIVQLTENGINSVGLVKPDSIDIPPAFCIFEYVYFSRADSVIEGQLVYEVRKESGRQLALEASVKADIVSTIPESATPSAFGFSEASGIPYREVLVKNRYVGRTFIQPCTRLRKLGVKTKFGPLTQNFEGKRIVLLDDSIVRGNTMGPIIQLLKSSGAKEVHIRVASPPIKYPCFMGINIPTKEELIANRMNAEQLAKHLGADSLVYLTVEGLVSAIQKGIQKKDMSKVGHCTACLTGEYPVELEW